VGVNIVLGVFILGHESSDLTGKKDSLHVLVLEGENCKKSFPYLLIEQRRFADFRAPSTAPERWATDSWCVIILARHGVTNARQIHACCEGDGAGCCADQEKSKCSPGIPDTRGVQLCPEGECERRNGVRGYYVALRAVRRSCEQSTQCRR
jgi:hypothetical protein